VLELIGLLTGSAIDSKGYVITDPYVSSRQLHGAAVTDAFMFRTTSPTRWLLNIRSSRNKIAIEYSF
jgi:hypothetical protein